MYYLYYKSSFVYIRELFIIIFLREYIPTQGYEVCNISAISLLFLFSIVNSYTVLITFS